MGSLSVAKGLVGALTVITALLCITLKGALLSTARAFRGRTVGARATTTRLGVKEKEWFSVDGQ